MSYAICCVAVAPIRIEPDHGSEMVSQLLFGECCSVSINNKSEWIKIVCKADTYTGWCQLQHVTAIDDTHYYNEEQEFTANWVNEINYNGHLMMVPFGSSLMSLKNGKTLWRKNTVNFSGKVWNPLTAKRDEKTIKEIADKFLNTTYLWGGRSVFGIDCSGLTQAVYSFLNIQLLRDANLQATQGELVNFLQEARCGDLAFFDNEDGQIIHVGILLNNQQILHTSGKVRIDKIDNEGIVNAETGERTQKLRIIKRYF